NPSRGTSARRIDLLYTRRYQGTGDSSIVARAALISPNGSRPARNGGPTPVLLGCGPATTATRVPQRPAALAISSTRALRSTLCAKPPQATKTAPGPLRAARPPTSWLMTGVQKARCAFWYGDAY